MHKITPRIPLWQCLLASLTLLNIVGCQMSPPTPSVVQSIPYASVDTGPTTARGARTAEVKRILAAIDFRPDGAVPRQLVSPWVEPSLLPTQPEEDSPLGRARHAWTYGQRREALRFAVEASWHEPHDVEAWTFLGRLLRLEGAHDTALSALLRARTEAASAPVPSTAADVAIAAEMARLFEVQGSYDDAITAWNDVLASDPDHTTATRRLASLHWLRGDIEVATALAEDLLTQEVPSETAETAILPPQIRGAAEPVTSHATVRTRQASLGGIAPPLRIDTGGASQAAEVHITAGANGALLAGWNDLRETNSVDAWSLGVGSSSDGGQTWTDNLLRAPGNNGEDFEGDPMGVYDPRTGNQWVGGITFFPNRNIYVARRPPGGNLLQPIIIESGMIFDKGLLAAGPMPGQPNTTRLYVTYNLGLQTSSDLGTSWSSLIPLGDGVSQHPRVGPDGTLYIAYWDFVDKIVLQRSIDGGATVQSPLTIATRLDVWDAQDGSRFPGRFRVAPIAYLAIDPNDGTLYCVYFDTTSVNAGQRNIDIYFTRSQDQGFTWTLPRVVNGDSDPPADQFFPWLEVDTSGTLHLAFFDSRHTAQVDDQETGFFDVYYSTSRDRGDTWDEVRISPTSFNSGDATWPGFEQFMGDFISLTTDPDPSNDVAWVAYAATYDGDLNIYVQRVEGGPEIFGDGFESGDLARWSNSSP